MNDNTVNEEWFDQQQRQPDIPSPEAAWSNMLAKLEEAMPVDDAIGNMDKQPLFPEKKIYLLVILLLLLNVNSVKDGFYSNQKRTAAKDVSSNASTNTQQSIAGQNTASAITDKTTTAIISNHQKHLLKAYQKKHNNTISNSEYTFKQKENNSIAGSTAAVKDAATTTLQKEDAAINNKKISTQPPKLNPSKYTDSLANEEEADADKKLLVQAGLQWRLPLPIAGTQHYFAGPAANEQPWRMLLPGAWVSVQADKNMLMAEVNPFASASFNPKPFYNSQIADSLAILVKLKSITKVFGVSGAISFQHNIAGNWWAGAGLQASFWKKGVAVLIVNKHDIITNTNTSSAQPYVLSKADWQYFSKFQLYPHLQLMYRGNSYQAGVRAGATFTSLAKDNGARNLVFAEAFFRLPLISNNHHN